MLRVRQSPMLSSEARLLRTEMCRVQSSFGDESCAKVGGLV